MNQPADAIPKEFLERLAQIVPADQYPEIVGSFSSDRLVGVRVNTLTADVEETVRQLTDGGIDVRPVTWCPAALVANPSLRSALVDCEAFAQRKIYIQNLASLLPVLVLDPQPDEMVLDLAAAPGGKTLHMAAIMGNQGQISAVEVVRNRFYKLRENLRLAGATMVRTYLKDGRAVGTKTPERFDRVLIDAPCSSEARFRRDRPESWQFWSLRKIREQSRKQRGLLRSGLRALKPGGVLVYCTCSFAPEENELVIDRQLRRDNSVELIPFELPIENVQPGLTKWNKRELSADLALARRVIPSSATDAFFICLLRKRRHRAR